MWRVLVLLAVLQAGSPTGDMYSYSSSEMSRLTRRGSGSADENYGLGLASCGERAFIGSYTDKYHYMQSGAVYVYALSSLGSWSLESKLHPSATADIFFGWSVACHNRTVVVGAYGDNSPDVDKAGSVYMYNYKPSILPGKLGSWQQTGIFYSENPQTHEYFGWATAIHDNLLVISAIGNNDLHSECGLVYAYRYTYSTSISTRRMSGQEDINDGDDYNDDKDQSSYSSTPSGWSFEAVLSAPNPFAFMNFGWSLGVYDNIVIVGAPWMNSRRGEVYIFNRELAENSAYDDMYYMDEGEYTYTALLTLLSSTLTNDEDVFDIDTKSYFGNSIAIDDDIIVIGHYLGHSRGNGNTENSIRTGRAFVCKIDFSTEGEWQFDLVADLTEAIAKYLSEYSFFGYDVSISGRTIVVGAPGDGHSNKNTSAFVFTASDAARTKWKYSHQWHGKEFTILPPHSHSENLAPSRFGIATAVSEAGRLVFVSDSKGMSTDYIQTGCVFSWIGKFEDATNEGSFMNHTLVLTMSVAFFVALVVVIRKRRQRTQQTNLDNILDDHDNNISMEIGTNGSEKAPSFLYGILNKVVFVIRRRLSLDRGMEMVSLPTESSHADDSIHSNIDLGDYNASKSVDIRKLIATAQAVADDENHPNHEEVAELISSYKRDWVSSERFQKEFQRLVF